MTPLPGSPFRGDTAWSLAMHPSGSGSPIDLYAEPRGRFVYMSDSTSNQIWAWTVHESGLLSAVPGAPFATGPQPWDVASDAGGRFLYVGTQPARYGPGVGVGPQLWGHRIDAETGALWMLSGFPYVPPSAGCPQLLSAPR